MRRSPLSASISSVRVAYKQIARSTPRPYAGAGRRLTSPRHGRGRPYRQVPTAVDPAAVRAWAIANDYEISARGRVPAAIIEEHRAGGN
jgi:hypothetical protein